MKHVFSTLMTIGALTAVSLPAFAQETAPMAPKPQALGAALTNPAMTTPPIMPFAATGEGDELSKVALTLDMVQLLFPLVELTGEYQLSPKMGTALIAGIGSLKEDGNAYSMWEIGAQFRYYLLGDFDHGLQIGAEISHLSLSLEDNKDDGDVSATGSGTNFGSFLGYKFAAESGLTIDIQIGYQYSIVSAEAEASDGETSASAKDSENTSGGLLNFNLGWSF